MKQLDRVEVGKMRQLASFLRTVPPSQFDLEEWELQAATPAVTFLFGLIEIEPACGFAGCAMGWAAHSKLFDGLYMDGSGPVYNGIAGWNGVTRLFGISSRAADFLFGSSSYEDGQPGYVADRLERFAGKVEAAVNRKRVMVPITEPEVVALQKPRLVA